MAKKVIDAMWFNPNMGSIGIVLSESDTGEKMAYINKVSGLDEAMDTQQILNWGGKITLNQAQRLVNHLTPKEDE